MAPLARIVVGFAIVVLDFRIDGFDLVPDLVGWLLVLAGLLPLWARSGGFAAAGVAALAGALLSVPQQVGEPGPVLEVLAGAAETVVVFGTCTGLIALVPDPRVTRSAGIIRWADLGITALGTALALAVDGEVSVGGAAAVPLVVFVVVALAVVVWFLVLLWTQRLRPELAAAGTAADPGPGTP